MDIKIISTGSKAGNCYMLADRTTKILLDIGITYKNLQIATKFKTTEITAALITHEHKDHIKGAAKAAGAGMDIYLSSGTAQAAGLSGHRVHIIKGGDKFNIGTIDCMAFAIEHDAAEPLGYVATSRISKKRTAYITDTQFLRFKIPGVTHWIMEVNYDENSLDANADEGRISDMLARRIKRTHMSLATLIEMLKANDLSETEQIYLVHLSENNADKSYIKSEVQKITQAEIII